MLEEKEKNEILRGQLQARNSLALRPRKKKSEGLGSPGDMCLEKCCGEKRLDMEGKTEECWGGMGRRKEDKKEKDQIVLGLSMVHWPMTFLLSSSLRSWQRWAGIPVPVYSVVWLWMAGQGDEGHGISLDSPSLPRKITIPSCDSHSSKAINFLFQIP